MGKQPASRPPPRAPEGFDIRVRGHNVAVTAALRAHIERRIAFALSRFGEKVGRVTVHCTDTCDQPSGGGKRCQIAVDLQRAVRVQETDPDLFTAISRAADRAERSVARALERDRDGDGQPAYPVPGRRRRP